MSTVEVYTWEPNANSGKPLFALHEKRVSFVHHYIDMGEPRMTPELCSEEITPNAIAWLTRVQQRRAVQRLADYARKDAA